MKLSNLFKKLLTATIAVALLGMLAACANGNDSSDGGSGSGGIKFDENEHYDLEYNDAKLLSFDGKTASNFIKAFCLKEETDFTFNKAEKKIVLTDSGYAKYNNVYTVKLEDGIVIDKRYPKVQFSQLEAIFDSSDYSVNGDDITLKDKGLSKLLTAMGYYAFLIYGDDSTYRPITQEQFNFAQSRLESSEYTLKHNDMVVIITEEVWHKVKTFF